MRIEGANDFLSRVAAWPDRAKNPLDPFVIRPEQDIIELSEIGKRLSLQAREEVKVTETKAKTNGDAMLSLMDKSMSNMEATLTQMKELAVAAANPNVTIADRLQMQIDMEKLRERLGEESGGMSRELAKQSGYEEAAGGKITDFSSVRAVMGDPANFDGRTLLERARDRALKGEAWDVAEGYERVWELRKVIVAGEDPKEFTIENGEWFDLPPEIDPEENVLLLMSDTVGGGYFVTDSKEVPTVSQILKESGTVMLTDVKSALEGVERIEMELGDLRDMREEFAAFCETPAASIDADLTSASVMAEMEPASEESADEKPVMIRTQLGYMEEVEEKGMRLTRPKSPKGQMFAKIQNLFDRIGGRLADGTVPDIPNRPGIDKITWTNRAQSWFADEADSSKQIYEYDASAGMDGVLKPALITGIDD